MAEHADTKGYYRTLRLQPDATAEEIQLAFELLEELPDEERGAPLSDVLRAYSVLKDPAARRAYDQMQTMPSATRTRGQSRARGGSLFDDVRILIACGVLLVGVMGFVWYPLYGSRFRSFSTGDQLVDLKGAPFGLVVKSDEYHAFPGGVEAPAYLIEVHATGTLVWYPASDLTSTCRRAR